MRRSAKRSRKAAKPQGETGSAQKAFATVGSAVRDGASTGLLSANLNVAPILFFNFKVRKEVYFLLTYLLTAFQLHPPRWTDKILCRFFGAPATASCCARVFPDHLITSYETQKDVP